MICADCINGDHNVCRDCPCQHVTVTVGGVPVSEALAAEAIADAEEGSLKRAWDKTRRALSDYWRAVKRPTTNQDWMDSQW